MNEADVSDQGCDGSLQEDSADGAVLPADEAVDSSAEDRDSEVIRTIAERIERSEFPVVLAAEQTSASAERA